MKCPASQCQLLDACAAPQPLSRDTGVLCSLDQWPLGFSLRGDVHLLVYCKPQEPCHILRTEKRKNCRTSWAEGLPGFYV